MALIMKKRFVILALCVMLVGLSLFMPGTFAWFTDGISAEKVFEIGDLRFVLNGVPDDWEQTGVTSATADEEPGGTTTSTGAKIVVPGEKLLPSTLTMKNESNIESELRMIISYTYKEPVEIEGVTGEYEPAPTTAEDVGGWYTGSEATPLFQLNLGANWELGEESKERYFYYKHGNEETILPIPEEGETGVAGGELGNVITGLAFADSITVKYSGTKFNLRIVFQAKQARFADWDDIGHVELSFTPDEILP